jgi:hypothetical protein
MINAVAAHSVHASSHGRIFGMTSGAAFLGAFLGSVAAGQLAAALGLGSVFIASSLWLFAAAWALRRWPALQFKDVSGAATP